jgi:RimJ/RimL family protein N-acetyltransferase
MIKIKKIIYDDLLFLNSVRNECAPTFLHDSRTFSIEETIKWFIENDPNYWIIWDDDKRIGYFRTSNYSVENKNIYIGADIHVEYRGLGLAYKSYRNFIPFLFDTLKLHKISLEVLSTNERAICLYKKLGFKVDGIKREEILKNNEWTDSIIMSVLNTEYV